MSSCTRTRLESHLYNLEDGEKILLQPILEVPNENMIILDALV
jgi:hypothetical protein